MYIYTKSQLMKTRHHNNGIHEFTFLSDKSDVFDHWEQFLEHLYSRPYSGQPLRLMLRLDRDTSPGLRPLLRRLGRVRASHAIHPPTRLAVISDGRGLSRWAESITAWAGQEDGDMVRFFAPEDIGAAARWLCEPA